MPPHVDVLDVEHSTHAKALHIIKIDDLINSQDNNI
ncbi:hypothetical protein EMIT0357P_20771 [Pseudomonas marginalis]